MPGEHAWSQADLHAWQVLRPLLDTGPYLPWSEGALRPSALVAIANEIVFGGRREIAELGSGVSTIVLARLLREQGGRLVSLEHDPDWAHFVRDALAREGLGSVARLAEGPLEPHELALEGAPWYSGQAVRELPEAIDLLLVDGPPGYGEGMALSRYPALPVLAGRLATGALVVLDDADRDPEREIVERWSREGGDWEFAVLAAEGIAIGHRPG